MTEHDNDNHILRGLDVLVNQDEVADGIDLQEVERSLAYDTPVYRQQPVREPINDVMMEMADKYGINIDDILGEAAQAKRAEVPRRSSPISATPRESPAYQTPIITSDEDYSRESLNPRQNITNEQRRRESLNRVVKVDESFSEDLEYRENLEDEKATMLADIDQLMFSLESDGADVKRLQEHMVNENSTHEEVSNMLRLLRKKVDNTRGSAMTEELIIFGASALEELFDGKNKWFGYSPDLTGYSNVARVKLRRVRHETSVLASSVMQSRSFGPGWRLLLELIPSMILHSRMRRQQHGEKNLFDDDSMVQTNTVLSRQ